jgi:uncharacterized protein (TIGR02996 family)
MVREGAFLEAVLAHPGEEGPRLVWADWLEECGDPRGAWLRFAAADFSRAARAAAVAPHEPDGGFYLRVDRLLRRPGGKRLLRLAAAAFLRWVPAGSGRAWDLLDENLKPTVAAAELHACGLLGAAALATPWKTTRLARDVAAEAADAAARLAAVAVPEEARPEAKHRARAAAIRILAAAHQLTPPPEPG